MSTIKTELQNLRQSFAGVAAAIRQELPEIWAGALEVQGNKEDAAVEMLCRKNMYFNGQSPAEYAIQSAEGRKQVYTYLQQLKYGVYP